MTAPPCAPRVAALSGCRSSGSAVIPEARADESSSTTNPGGFAVVELFTSEGCSSCPPADVLLSDLERQVRSIFVLEFHVDYWDGLGWPDRFSSPDWTGRQRAYSRSFGTSELYTPEMIVGGTDPFNGTDRGRAAGSPRIARASGAHSRVGSVTGRGPGCRGGRRRRRRCAGGHRGRRGRGPARSHDGCPRGREPGTHVAPRQWSGRSVSRVRPRRR